MVEEKNRIQNNQNLKMNKLNLDNTELMIEGEIVSIVYSENYSKTNFLHKIFK